MADDVGRLRLGKPAQHRSEVGRLRMTMNLTSHKLSTLQYYRRISSCTSNSVRSRMSSIMSCHRSQHHHHHEEILRHGGVSPCCLYCLISLVTLQPRCEWEK
ncbi:hypothetical protein MTR_7g058770 [Medicago truncatula]|uniref:Uncharacterized protein n=1 Tax=Medicago truncatula TaxID=3880 RepID=G7L1B8_MEDTR|nr:hypothetical protein MTR_7g058770 [Medicago truncatula]